MTSHRRSIFVLFAALAITPTFLSAALASEQMEKPKKRHARAVYVERDYAYDCRTGWWSTVRYGHEWPRWGTWCRR
jgi:hypothetical protein